jgi:hypothetical protein
MNTPRPDHKPPTHSHVGFFVAMLVVVVCAGAAYYALDKFLVHPQETNARTDKKASPSTPSESASGESP